jgi:hypothetical protein
LPDALAVAFDLDAPEARIRLDDCLQCGRLVMSSPLTLMMMSCGSKPRRAAGEPRVISSITTPFDSVGICSSIGQPRREIGDQSARERIAAIDQPLVLGLGFGRLLQL